MPHTEKTKATREAERDEEERELGQSSLEKSGRKRRKADAATNSGRSESEKPLQQKPAHDSTSVPLVQIGETVMCRLKDAVRKLRAEPHRSDAIGHSAARLFVLHRSMRGFGDALQ